MRVFIGHAEANLILTSSQTFLMSFVDVSGGLDALMKLVAIGTNAYALYITVLKNTQKSDGATSNTKRPARNKRKQ